MGNNQFNIVTSPKDYFDELVQTALESRGIDTYPHVSTYLSNLLNYYVDIRNLYESPIDEAGNRKALTLAELLLTAQSSEPSAKVELLKKLGDRALYISGFFSDSLNRKLVDIDYYRDMGVTAYSSLASTVKEDTLSRVFEEISVKFIDFVDAFTIISQKTFVKTDESILRLYENYLRTGSELAKQRLTELGVIPVVGGGYSKQS